MLQNQDQTGWVTNKAGTSYPPAPWFLGGALTGSVLRIPASRLPDSLRATVPPDHHLVTFAGVLPVTVAFVHYAAGGVLAYEELLVSVPVRRGWRVRVSVPQIWVDSESSHAGGRELWNIPKDLATFDHERDRDDVRTAMSDANGEVASLQAHARGSLLPGRWQFPLTTAQRLEGSIVVSSNSIIGRLRRTRAQWHFNEHGPLAWLNGARSLADLMIDEAIVVFGEQVKQR